MTDDLIETIERGIFTLTMKRPEAGSANSDKESPPSSWSACGINR